MHKADIEYCKLYGNPSIPEAGIFYGPVTVAEIKRNAAIADDVIRRKRLDHRKKFEANRVSDCILEDNKENEFIQNESKRDINDTDPKLVSLDLDSPTKSDSINDSHIPPYVALNRCQNLNKNLNEKRPLFHASPFLAQKSNLVAESSEKRCLIEETFNDETTLLMMAKYAMSRESPVKRGSPLSKEKVSPIEISATKVVRMSEEFLNEISPDNVLIDLTITEKDQIQGQTNKPTPDILKEERNSSWKFLECETQKSTPKLVIKNQNSPWKYEPGCSALLPNSVVKSKLPVSRNGKLNSQHLFVQSPVANYIRNGVKVQSQSKNRHSLCIEQHSKSESKASRPSCRIPIFASKTVKRKLVENINEKKPLFNNSILTK